LAAINTLCDGFKKVHLFVNRHPISFRWHATEAEQIGPQMTAPRKRPMEKRCAHCVGAPSERKVVVSP